MMNSEKYLDLRPWHFAGGDRFPPVLFREYQYALQRRQNSLWLYLLIPLLPVWLVVFFAVQLPRKREADRLAKRLGIGGELKQALTRLSAGTAAYEPTKAALDAWKELEEEEDRLASEAAWRKQSPSFQRKLLFIWSVILLAVALIILVFGISMGVSNGWQTMDLLPLILGTLVFGGAGVYALIKYFRP